MSLTSSVTVAPTGLLGAQRPRIEIVPAYATTTGDEAIELAALAGLVLDDWQQFVLRGMLGETPDGKWSAPTVGIVVGRQNGKGSVLEARELAGLFLLGERFILHTAHLQKPATAHFRRLRDLIRGCPSLNVRLASAPEGKGSEAIVLKTGQRIEFTTRRAGSARGLTADCVVYDEAMHLAEAETSAITSTVSARTMSGAMQLIYAGSAVDQQNPAHDGVPFARVRAAALGGAARVMWCEWSLDGDPSTVSAEVLASPESHAATNPSYGIRIAPEFIGDELTIHLSARGFAVERLSIGDWPDPTGDAGRVITDAMWARLADHASRLDGAPTFAVDVDPDQAWATIAAAGERADGLWHIGVVDHRRSTTWVVERMVELLAQHDGATVIMDAHAQAKGLIIDLEAAGVYPVRVTGPDYGEACAGFMHVIADDRLRYMPPQPELDEAVVGARRTGLMQDAWKWSRKDSGTVITPLVASTLALWGARTQGAPQVWSLAEIVQGLQQSPDVAEPVVVRSGFIPLGAMPHHH